MKKASKRPADAAKKKMFEKVSAHLSQQVRVMLSHDLESHVKAVHWEEHDAEVVWTLGALDGLLDALALLATVRLCGGQGVNPSVDPSARDLYDRIYAGLRDALLAAIEPVIGSGDSAARIEPPSGEDAGHA